MVDQQQTVVAREGVPLSVAPNTIVRLEAPSTSTKQPRTVGCSLRCTVVVFFIIVAMLLCAYLTVAVLALLNDGVSKQIDRLKKENERLEIINDNFTRENEEYAGLIIKLGENVTLLEDEVGNTRKENSRLKVSLNNFDTQLVTLSLKLEDLKQFNEDIVQDAGEFSEQVGELQDLSNDLNSTILKIESQLEEYQDLREEITKSLDGSEDQIADVVQGINDAFNRVKQLSSTNLMLNIYSRVVSTERIDGGSAGFNELEFQRLVDQSAPVLNVTGDLPQGYLTFPEGETVITTLQVLTMIQEYIINSTDDKVLAANLDKKVPNTN
eukprot:TRINITY_DN3440_c0_g1_i16.p1 TRINITY_DN3440_c0_g1~~TRINITY_DN3440_c0_g1_i16.p1  ORF type:complete len:325 (-),score=38.63 TRINITY_DN3440_c0_g1_i16:985-1959(-)